MRTLTTLRQTQSSPSDADLATRLTTAKADGFWLDIESPVEADFKLLEQVFHVHPLAVEDVREGHQRPKLEEYPNHAFLVLFVPRWTGSELTLQEHNLIIGPNFLITVHAAASLPMGEMQARMAKSPDLCRGRAELLTYLVIDALVDATFPVLDSLDDGVDALEDEIVEQPDPEQLQRTYSLKHAVTDLRRLLGSQRDAFQRLLTHSIGAEANELSLYYRDIYDHLVRQYEMADGLRDLLSSAMDVYLSTVSNRTNDTMKTLTVISSLFLPLTFLTGFFGMNFPYLTDRLEHSPVSFWIGTALMAASAVAQFFVFRSRRWV